MDFPSLASVFASALVLAPGSGSEVWEVDVVESQDNMDHLFRWVSERVMNLELSLGVDDLAGDPDAEEVREKKEFILPPKIWEYDAPDGEGKVSVEVLTREVGEPKHKGGISDLD